jgi:5-methylcytosine-specific restriction endonuclease McrA
MIFARHALMQLEDFIESEPERIGNVLMYWRSADYTRELLRQEKARTSYAQQRCELLRNGGLADRPPRRMPVMRRILAHHELSDAYCVRCGYEGSLERAHIIDRCYGGLDGPQNLAPLCSLCHRQQPIFQPGDETVALEWFGLRQGSPNAHTERTDIPT